MIFDMECKYIKKNNAFGLSHGNGVHVTEIGKSVSRLGVLGHDAPKTHVRWPSGDVELTGQFAAVIAEEV